jgi:hypothetical protein
MKTLNIPFDNKEYEALNKVKGKSNWKTFLLSLIKYKEKKK